MKAQELRAWTPPRLVAAGAGWLYAACRATALAMMPIKRDA